MCFLFCFAALQSLIDLEVEFIKFFELFHLFPLPLLSVIVNCADFDVDFIELSFQLLLDTLFIKNGEILFINIAAVFLFAL
jgi:hypothetical protein